jgi:glutathionylspermidine synthase
MIRRIANAPRADWQAKVEALGLVWHTLPDGSPYWSEAAHYSLSLADIEQIEAATVELYRLFMDAGDHIVRSDDLLMQFGIPAYCFAAIRAAWADEPPALNYGRFDLGFDGKGPPKLFEFNCDTPTSLIEAAVVQWDWKEAHFPDLDQFNSLHDKLAAKWADLAALKPPLMHFTHSSDAAGEDVVTVSYLRDLAEKAGISTKPVYIDDLGWDADRDCFVDQDDAVIRVIFKLYPWEWLVNEEFGQRLIQSLGYTTWMEPIWKMIWSNKAILPVLWQLFPGHPNLLPAFIDEGQEGAALTSMVGTSFVLKPLLAREGANIEVVKDGRIVTDSGGDYGEEGRVFQALYDLPDFDGNRPVIGSWIVDGEAAGMGIREDGLITGNTARFVPHIIKG